MRPELVELRRWIEKAEHDIQTADAALGLSRPVTDTPAFRGHACTTGADAVGGSALTVETVTSAVGACGFRVRRSH